MGTQKDSNMASAVVIAKRGLEVFRDWIRSEWAKCYEELELSASTVYNNLKKYRIPLRSKDPRPDPTKEEIEALYYGEGLTFSETARMLRIGSERLATLMRGYGIVPKPKSQRKYSNEEILDEIRRAIERYGRIPLQKELRYDDEFKIDVKTVVRRFGSWKAAIEKVKQEFKI